jgi:hypothetical protein
MEVAPSFMVPGTGLEPLIRSAGLVTGIILISQNFEDLRLGRLHVLLGTYLNAQHFADQSPGYSSFPPEISLPRKDTRAGTLLF